MFWGDRVGGWQGGWVAGWMGGRGEEAGARGSGVERMKRQGRINEEEAGGRGFRHGYGSWEKAGL